MDRPGRRGAHQRRAQPGAQLSRPDGAPTPLPLLDRAPPRGAPALVLGREPGFALHLERPGDAGGFAPPGQGQLLVPLAGTVRVEEQSEAATKVTQTDRRSRSAELAAGQLWRVANDASWRVTGEDAVLLRVATSVPREESRREDLLATARRTLTMAPRRVFGNEVLRVEVAVGRSRLPGVGWVPWSHRTEGAEYAVILAGRWRARLQRDAQRWDEDLPAGTLLRIPPRVAHNVRARTTLRPSVGLILTSLRRSPEGAVRKEAVQGFSPFVDRG